MFFEWFTDASFRGFRDTGSTWRRPTVRCPAGVLRGVHFAQLPPSQAEYVTCVHGSVFDVVVDIRVGSPTFGQWDSVLLDDQTRRTIYISEGLGHAFMSLRDSSYGDVPVLDRVQPRPRAHHPCHRSGHRHRVARRRGPADPVDRDADAPTLAEVEAAGLLPTWQDARAFVDELRHRNPRFVGRASCKPHDL